ncbi:MAG TPA: hypothetical protein VGL13_12170, partial [Polyangiaceae bacterium]
DLPDEGPPFVRHALGDLDAAKALALLPADLVPIQLGKGRVHYQVDELAIDRPTTSAKVALDVEVADAMVPVGAGSASVDSAQLTLRVQPSDKGLGVEAEAHWGELRVEQKAPNGLSARDCKFAIHAHDLAVDTKDPMATRGDVAFDGSIGSLENRGALRSTFSELKLRAHAPLSGAPPFALDASVEAKRFALAQPNGKLMVDTPARLDLGLKNVTPDREHPRASQGEAHLVLSAGALDVKLDADKKADEVSFDLTTKAGTLAGVRRFVPESVATRAPWDAMAVDLHTTARVEHFGDPQIHQQSHLHLTGAAFAPARVPDVTLDFHSDGSAAKHEAELTARAGSVVIDKTELGADELQMSLTVDRSKPALAVKIANHGAMDSELDGSFGFDSSDRAVTYELAGRLAKLAPILPLLNSLPGLAHFDFESFGLRLQSRGRVTGVISRIDGQSIVVAPDPARTLGAKGTAQFEMTKFRWAEGDRAITVPAGTLRTSFHGEGQHRSMESDFSADDVEIGLGRHRLSIAGLRDETAASWIGSFGDGAAEVSHRASIREVQQNFYPTYPVANVTTSLAARLDAEGVFKVSAFRLENAAGGSTITLTGGVDLSADQRRLSLRTTIDQDLSRFSTRPERFTGSGKAGVELSVESPDFRVFHSRARVSLEGATIRLPRSGIVLENVDGEVPIVTDVALGQHGPELLRDAHLNPYAVLRFADQHPLLSHRSFLSIGSVTTPMVSIAPFAANLRIEQNFFSLSQLEMGVRGGSVTGSGILDWNGGKTQVHADLHATGVQSSHGEPFDGNASLVIDMGDHSVEGRADILRIGSRHLLDLLDVQDPHRANAQLNRIRGALSLGYPERVRIAFKHGFMSAGVSLGGLARLVSIDDVRGIPIGPLMERMMRSFKPPEEQ